MLWGHWGSPCGSDGKAYACNAGDQSSIPGSGRSPAEGNGYPLQYSCLENPMDGGAWWATVHGVAKSQTQLSDFTFTFHLGTSRYQEKKPQKLVKLKFLPGLKHTNNTVTAVVVCSRLFFFLCIYTLLCRHIYKHVLLFETPVGLIICLAQWLAFSVLSCADFSRMRIDPFLSNATLYCIYGFKLWPMPTHVLIRNKF